MLDLTLHQFMGLALMIGDAIDKRHIPDEAHAYIKLHIGDPALDGSVAVDFSCPELPRSIH